jgi:hypothetical protein
LGGGSKAEILSPLCALVVAERLLMGSPKNHQGNVKVNAATPPRPRPPRPAGEQAISPALYAQIRQAIAEIKR